MMMPKLLAKYNEITRVGLGFVKKQTKTFTDWVDNSFNRCKLKIPLTDEIEKEQTQR